MARKILLQNETVIQVLHEATHDIESFIWVLSYCVMRNLHDRASQRSAPKEVRDQCHEFRSLFCLAFGQTTIFEIANERLSESCALIFTALKRVKEITTSFMSNTLVALFQDLQNLLHNAANVYNPIPLTHDSVLTVVNQRLESLY
jgi:hypothetical protein